MFARCRTRRGRPERITTQTQADQHDFSYESPPAVSLCLPAERESLRELRETLRVLLRNVPLDPLRRHEAEVAATEAASNVVQHAYPRGVPGTLELEADFELGSVEVVVRDHGQGMRANSPVPSRIGIGLPMIAALCDDFAITEHHGGGVEVWMRFVCS
jgi:anti-sigma regulatory factor (Ser/Thr protein kinase)